MISLPLPRTRSLRDCFGKTLSAEAMCQNRLAIGIAAPNRVARPEPVLPF